MGTVFNLEKVVSILSWRKLFVHDGIVLKAMSGNLKCSFNFIWDFLVRDYSAC